MATSEEPPVFDAAEQGWRAALAAMHRMPFVTSVAVLIVTAPSIVAAFVKLPVVRNPTIEQIFLFAALAYLSLVLLVVVQSVLLAPAAIAAHRFVLLNETASRYTFSFEARRWIFFLFFLGVEALLAGPDITKFLWSFIVESFLYIGKAPEIPDWRAPAIIFCLFYVAALFILLRVLILFPAIATDARGAGWRNAAADSKGHTWRIFAIIGVTAIPIIGLQVALLDFRVHSIYWIDRRIIGPLDLPQNAVIDTIHIIFALIGAVVRVFALYAFAAVASRLCTAFAKKLNG